MYMNEKLISISFNQLDQLMEIDFIQENYY